MGMGNLCRQHKLLLYQRGACDMTVLLGLVVRHYYFLWPQPSNKQSQRNLLEIADHGGKIGQNSLNNIAAQCLYVAPCNYSKIFQPLYWMGDTFMIYDIRFMDFPLSKRAQHKVINISRPSVPAPPPFNINFISCSD